MFESSVILKKKENILSHIYIYIFKWEENSGKKKNSKKLRIDCK